MRGILKAGKMSLVTGMVLVAGLGVLAQNPSKITDNSKLGSSGDVRPNTPQVKDTSMKKLTPEFAITKVEVKHLVLRVFIENKGPVATERDARISAVMAFVKGTPPEFLKCLPTKGMFGWGGCAASDKTDVVSGTKLPKLAPGQGLWIDLKFSGDWKPYLDDINYNWGKYVAEYSDAEKKNIRLGLRIATNQVSFADPAINKKVAYAKDATVTVKWTPEFYSFK
jgi:hypothetical protein